VGENSSSSEIGAEENPAVKEEKTVADFSQRHVEESQDGKDVEDRNNCAQQRGEKAGQDKEVDKDVSNKVVGTTDVPHLTLDGPLKEKAGAADKSNSQQYPKGAQNGFRKTQRSRREKDIKDRGKDTNVVKDAGHIGRQVLSRAFLFPGHHPQTESVGHALPTSRLSFGVKLALAEGKSVQDQISEQKKRESKRNKDSKFE